MANDMTVMASLPEDLADREVFAQRLVSVYGEQDALRLAREAAHSRPGVSYWINSLRFPAGQAPTTIWPEDQALLGVPGIWVAQDRERVTHSSEAQTGEVYVQNPASFAAVRVLDPLPGEEVLDLAAAPGGKTIAIAAAMQNCGRVAAVEPVAGRFHRLKANAERCGVDIVQFYQRDGRGVGKAVGERFDRVLLDAPCSSESRMRWDKPESYRHWQSRKVKEVQRKQKSLLRSGYASLKPGGVLVYCTCSLNLEENELVIDHLLRKTNAQVVPIDALGEMGSLGAAGPRPGLTHNHRKALHPELHLTRRIFPAGAWDGFYIARLKKPSSG